MSGAEERRGNQKYLRTSPLVSVMARETWTQSLWEWRTHFDGRRIYTCKIQVQSAGSEDQQQGGGIMETMELLACVL